jgi:hypothetical protein
LIDFEVIPAEIPVQSRENAQDVAFPIQNESCSVPLPIAAAVMVLGPDPIADSRRRKRKCFSTAISERNRNEKNRVYGNHKTSSLCAAWLHGYSNPSKADRKVKQTFERL